MRNVRIDESTLEKDNPLRGLLEKTTKNEYKIRFEQVKIVETTSPNEDGDYKQHNWAIRRIDNEAELGTVYLCTDSGQFYHLGLKQTGIDGKDKADRMGHAKDLHGCVKKMLQNLWKDHWKRLVKS